MEEEWWLNDPSIYDEQSRDQAVDDDGLEPWEAAWMQGYEDDAM